MASFSGLPQNAIGIISNLACSNQKEDSHSMENETLLSKTLQFPHSNQSSVFVCERESVCVYMCTRTCVFKCMGIHVYAGAHMCMYGWKSGNNLGNYSSGSSHLYLRQGTLVNCCQHNTN